MYSARKLHWACRSSNYNQAMIEMQPNILSVESSSDLEQRVKNYLALQQFPAFRGLEINARDGIVTVRGAVRSFHERQVCIACCQRVAGVSKVCDQIHVGDALSERKLQKGLVEPVIEFIESVS
jgi:osmotically-inducible protein OsmY